jgi:hypothetical protein
MLPTPHPEANENRFTVIQGAGGVAIVSIVGVLAVSIFGGAPAPAQHGSDGSFAATRPALLQRATDTAALSSVSSAMAALPVGSAVAQQPQRSSVAAGQSIHGGVMAQPAAGTVSLGATPAPSPQRGVTLSSAVNSAGSSTAVAGASAVAPGARGAVVASSVRSLNASAASSTTAPASAGDVSQPVSPPSGSGGAQPTGSNPTQSTGSDPTQATTAGDATSPTVGNGTYQLPAQQYSANNQPFTVEDAAVFVHYGLSPADAYPVGSFSHAITPEILQRLGFRVMQGGGFTGNQLWYVGPSLQLVSGFTYADPSVPAPLYSTP